MCTTRHEFGVKERKQNVNKLSKEEKQMASNTMCKMAIRDLSVFEEVQGDLHILQLVEAHPSLLPWLQETRGRQASGGGSAGRQDV